LEPFLPQLIRDIGITDSRVPYYVGLMQSLFLLAQGCTIFYWNRLSDHIGRKPVILVGIFGLSASLWCFGLSKSFWGLVLSRCISGVLNGNLGVMKSMTIDITDSTNIAQAYGILPSVWYIGETLGPLVGGSLARPADRFPKIFGQSEFLKEYPYFLPCAVSASITAISWLIILIFMKEKKKPTMSLRQYIVGGTTKNDNPCRMVDDNLASEAAEQPVPFRALLVRPFIVATGSYATFFLIDICFRAMLPVFCAMPIDMGGLALDPPAIGVILASFGIVGGFVQWMFFAPVHDWLGAKHTFLATVALCLPMIALFPVINAVARVYGVGYLVWFLIGLQMILFVFAGFAYEIAFMYIAAAAPNKASLGATYGLSQVVVCVICAGGPAIVDSAFALSIEKRVMGGYFAYFVMTVIVGFTMWVGYLLPRKLWND